MFLLRFLALAVLLLLIALLAAPIVLLYQGLQPEPLVAATPNVSQEDVGRFKALLHEHDPRDLSDGETRTITVAQRDLNLGLRSVLPDTPQQQADAALDKGSATLRYTVQLPANPVGNYLNLTLVLAEDNGQPTMQKVRVGNVSVPGWTLTPLITLADHLLKRQFPEYAGAREALQEIAINEGTASFTYRWDQALAEQIEQRGRDVLLPPADRERALAYYQVFSDVSQSVGSKASLDRLLQPLFREAVQRSNQNDAAAENRVLLLVVGTALKGSSMQRLIGGDPDDFSPTHTNVRWSLNGRKDLAQHFGISAAIAAAGGGALADAVGVFKEMDDSRGGSGFSFPDLLADRAGVELSITATGTGARRIQRAMADQGLRQTDFMPAIDALPEGLMEMEFKKRYRDLDDARYADVKRELETRITRLPIYQ